MEESSAATTAAAGEAQAEFQPQPQSQSQSQQSEVGSQQQQQQPSGGSSNKHNDRLQRKKAAAIQKLDKVRQSFDAQLASLHQQQELHRHYATLIEHNTAAVDAAIASINVEVARGTDWTELQRVLKAERDKHNPIARMITALDLPTNTVTLALSHTMAHVRQGWVDGGREEDRVVEVEVDLGQSAYNNASNYYAQRKQHGAKADKTTETSERALRAVERRTAQQLKDSDARARIQQARRSYWFEKYHWFITSENLLVLSGRDATQAQLVAQRHLGPGDVYVCADVVGAVGVVVKGGGVGAGVVVPPLSIQQAACMCLCRSSAWLGKPGSGGGEAWWVRGDEVEVAADEKVALKAGVTKRYVTRMPLVMGLAVLFRVGDECVAAHKGERRIKGMMTDDNKVGEDTKQEEGDGKEDDREEDDDDTETEAHHNDEHHGDGDDEKATQEDDDEEEDNEEDAASGASHGTATKVVTAALKGLSMRGGEVKAASTLLQAANSEDGRSEGETSSKQSVSGANEKKKVSAAEKRRLKKAGEHNKNDSAHSVSADDDNSSEPSMDRGRAAGRQQHEKPPAASKPAGQLTRAQRAKQKKLAKYADQDEEDRSIAAQVLGLQSGKRRDSSNTHSADQHEDEEEDEQAVVAAETEQKQEGEQVKAEVTSSSAPTTASNKPTPATAPQRDPTNQICRGCKEKGHTYRDCSTRPQRPAALQTEPAADEPANYALDLIDALTGRPHDSDSLQFALCVCAPLSALVGYQYRVKLLPGSQKKGKVVQAAVSLWSRAAGGREAEREMIRGMREDEAMGVLCANVKVAAGMAGEQGKKRPKKEAGD